MLSKQAVEAIVNAECDDVFAILGPHQEDGKRVVRTFQPGASKVEVLTTSGKGVATELPALHEAGFFAGPVKGLAENQAYRLHVTWGDTSAEIEDPYRFGSMLGDLDLYLAAEGTHERIYDRLGAHIAECDGVKGVHFAVWAPSASRVSVVGDFNDWDGRRHVLRKHPGAGFWDIFVPNAGANALYKYEIRSAKGHLLPLKSDPYAFAMQHPPQTASIVCKPNDYRWNDTQWMGTRKARTGRDAPISIYEVHLGSWRRVFEEGSRYLSYRELADQLIPYVVEMGFTHIQLMPVSEYPFDGSWGYQPIGLFAPTSRFGTPDEFRYFVDQCHQHDIGVLIDWVPGHFPTDAHGIGEFDGTHLYEHADPRQGFHQDWNTYIYNFGRNEVANFLLSNALYWLEQFHIDGLRVDAVASMLYLDYSRNAGEWVPNEHGGRENLDAVKFLRRLNELAYGRHDGTVTIAEESTAWPAVSQPTYLGGLGFGYKWNMGWMNDTLRYMQRDPVHRKYHHHEMTFGLIYAFSENFVLPLSHDEVVHGKGSLLDRMPGDAWQKFANLRAYFGFMWGHPGKKLLFMGGEFAQGAEWNHNQSLDWRLLDTHWHQGVRQLVKDLNRVYRDSPALHQRDCQAEGFEWIEANDTDRSLFAFVRNAADDGKRMLVVSNFTPAPRTDCRVGVPAPGYYKEAINTDAALYGGSDTGNSGGVWAEPVRYHGREWSVNLTVPPLATLLLEHQG